MKQVLKMLLWGLLLLPLGSVADNSAAVDRLRLQINGYDGQGASSDPRQVWQSLQQLPLAQLIALSRHGDNNYFEQGWFELARDVRLAPAAQRPQQVRQWQQRWFHHPASSWLPYLDSAASRLAVPGEVLRLGVLLPLSGEFAEQGQEVLAGMRAALDWDQRQGYPVPQLQVFDSAAVTDLPKYLQTLVKTERPDLLVGPLRSQLTRQLTTAQPLPVLALNRVGGAGFNGYQLDLASDQELRQLVERIWQDGHRRILLLAPGGEAWVEPLLAWLEQFSRAQGLVIQARLRYETAPERLRWQLGQVLGINASRQRGQRLARLLAEPPKQQTRRRQDIDAVLLIARPEAARLIKPVLNYHQAAELPVYAGAHLFSGQVDAVRDRDLEGILFCDMPWRLRQRPGRAPSSSFFALGLDAGSVYRALPRMGAGTPGYFEGETGHLRLLEGWRLQRSLPCARFVEGKPRLVQPAQ